MRSTTSCSQILPFPQDGNLAMEEQTLPQPPYTPRNTSNCTERESENDNYNNNNIARARARTRVGASGESEKVLLEIGITFQECFGYSMSVPVKKSVWGYLKNNLVEPSLITAVMEYTAVTAPRPSWRYAATVINRQMRNGCRTDADFAEKCAEYELQRDFGIKPQPENDDLPW